MEDDFNTANLISLYDYQGEGCRRGGGGEEEGGDGEQAKAPLPSSGLISNYCNTPCTRKLRDKKPGWPCLKINLVFYLLSQKLKQLPEFHF